MNKQMKQQDFSKKAHILVVDDDQRIRELIMRYLWDHGFVVLEACDAAQAREMLSRFSFDALVLDVMMPGESGIELTRYLHEHHDVPVLLLTALGEVEDRISGLEAGADDYLPKPFEPRELLARLNIILRRTVKLDIDELQGFRIGQFIFDPKHNELSNGNTLITLTSVEVALIRALASKAGEAVSREELAELCDLHAGERTIDVQVTRLRRKIEKDTRNPRYLQTVRGKGYLLRTERL